MNELILNNNGGRILKRLLTVACLALAQLLVLGAARASAQPAAAEGPAHGRLRVCDARHGPQLQDDRPQLVRHDAHQPPAVLRPGVRRGREHLRRRAPDPPGRQGLRAHLDGRAADHVRVRNVRHGRGRRPDDVPAAARLRRARPVGRGPVPGARSWTSTSSRTRSSTWGPTGMVFFRNVQVRYMPIQGDTRLTIALERPGASGDAGLLADRIELQDVQGRSPLPDLTAEYRMGGSKGYVEVAGLLGRIEWDDLRDDAFDLSGSATRWGLNFSTNIKLGSSSTIRGQLVYGEGIQNYMNDAPVDVGIVRNPGNLVTPIKGEAIPLARQRDLPGSQLEQPVVDGGGLLAPGHRQHGGPGPRCVPAGPVHARQPALHAGARGDGRRGAAVGPPRDVPGSRTSAKGSSSSSRSNTTSRPP